jgi:hypothetical protein
MQARQRVRGFLLEGAADRPPFLPMATEFTAGLAQASVERLLSDPHLFMQSFLESVAVCGFDALLISIPPSQVASSADSRDGGDQLAGFREGLARLRQITGDRLALIPLLPGPRTMASFARQEPTAQTMEEKVANVLRMHETLDPPTHDAVAVLETEALDGLSEEELIVHAEALATIWNVAHYYSLPALLVAARADRRLSEERADAVTVWSGASPEELLAGGASRAGVPVWPPLSSPLSPCPPGGFYTTAGEIPSESAVSDVKDLVRRAGDDPAQISPE